MAVAFRNRKQKGNQQGVAEWQLLEAYTKIIRTTHFKQTREQGSSVHQRQWGERRLPQQGVRQAVVAAAMAAAAAAAAAGPYCSMLLIVLLVDSSFRCLVVYLRGTTTATSV